MLSCHSMQSSAVRLFASVYVHYVQSAQCLPKRLPGLGVAPRLYEYCTSTDARIRQPDLRSNSRCLPTSQLGLVPTGRTTSSVRFRHTSPTVVNMPSGAIARANFPRDRLGRVLWATSVVRLRYVICGLGPREDLACGIPTGVAGTRWQHFVLGFGSGALGLLRGKAFTSDEAQGQFTAELPLRIWCAGVEPTTWIGEHGPIHRPAGPRPGPSTRKPKSECEAVRKKTTSSSTCFALPGHATPCQARAVGRGAAGLKGGVQGSPLAMVSQGTRSCPSQVQ